MARTAFTSRLGTGQGRLAPGVFVLGDDEPGRFYELALGDRVEVAQSIDLTGTTLVRAAVRLRAPESIPTGFAWEASILVDGVKLAMARGWRGRERRITDLAANVSKLRGLHVVGLRLELVPG